MLVKFRNLIDMSQEWVSKKSSFSKYLKYFSLRKTWKVRSSLENTLEALHRKKWKLLGHLKHFEPLLYFFIKNLFPSVSQ